MPLTDLQRAHLHPQIADLCRYCEGNPAHERALLLHRTLREADANPTWKEWEDFVRLDLGRLPAALAHPTDTR